MIDPDSKKEVTDTPISSRERLRLLDLPVFDTVGELASLIHLDPVRLGLFVAKSDRFYKRFTVPKKTGGRRNICHPARELKAIQRWILRHILEKLATSPAATAFTPGTQLIDNTSPHESNRYFICVDIEDFFSSISDFRVQRLFRLIGYDAFPSAILRELCTCDGCLPQGAVTSPALSNLVAARLDRRLLGFTSRRNITYTRYADDITLSSNNRTILASSLAMVADIITSEGFTLQEAKTRHMGPRVRCRVTGLVKHSAEPHFGVGRQAKRRLRAAMHAIAIKGVPAPDYPTIESIEGWLRFCSGVDPQAHKQMSTYWVGLRTPK